MKDKIIKKANPNRHGWVYLKESSEHAGSYYIEDQADDYGDDDSIWFDDLDTAIFNWEALVKHYASVPNWEAQEEYDEMWGAPLEQYPRPSEY